MKRAALAILAATALALAGCGGPPPLKSGTVTAKRHIPQRQWTEQVPIYITVCQPSGKTTVCHLQLVGFNPVQHTDPECWRLSLRDGKRTGEACVSRATYDRTDLGEHYGVGVAP